jgi:hypothetical protein
MALRGCRYFLAAGVQHDRDRCSAGYRRAGAVQRVVRATTATVPTRPSPRSRDARMLFLSTSKATTGTGLMERQLKHGRTGGYPRHTRQTSSRRTGVTDPLGVRRQHPAGRPTDTRTWATATNGEQGISSGRPPDPSPWRSSRAGLLAVSRGAGGPYCLRQAPVRLAPPWLAGRAPCCQGWPAPGPGGGPEMNLAALARSALSAPSPVEEAGLLETGGRDPLLTVLLSVCDRTGTRCSRSTCCPR